MPARKSILFGVGIAILLAVVFGYFLYNKPHDNIARANADYSLSAVDLFVAFDSDESAANEKFLDKLIEVTGRIQDVKQDDAGNTILTLEGDGLMFGIICELDPHTAGHRADFMQGEEVTMKGICTGMLMDVVLVRCIEIDK